MNKYSIGLYEKAMPNNLSLEKKLNCTKECGFDFMEISIDESDEKLKRLYSSKEERLNLIKTMYDVGIPIRTMCLSAHRKYPLGSKDKNTRNKSMEIMEKSIELACNLGIRIIQLAGYDVYYEQSTTETKKNFLINLKKSVEMASNSGVILAFETMETEFMNTVEKAMTYVKKVNSPYLQVYPDCGNTTNAAMLYKKDVLQDIIKGRGHIVSVHLKETIPGKFREINFGEGHVNFEKIIKESLKLGVRRFVAEFWYTGQDNWKQIIKDTRRFMDHRFAKALECNIIAKIQS